MSEPQGFRPTARSEGIIRKEVDDELLVYDLKRDKAHCLNVSAAAIWKLCDGRTSIKEIADSLTKEVGTTVDERLVWLALADLRRSHLLEEPDRITPELGQKVRGSKLRQNSKLKPQHSSQWPEALPGMSRREAVRRIGLGAAIALPIVISITAPTPAQALSCVQSGGSCGTTPECCAGLLCSGGMCGAE